VGGDSTSDDTGEEKEGQCGEEHQPAATDKGVGEAGKHGVSL
jgi:hypothetical protein